MNHTDHVFKAVDQLWEEQIGFLQQLGRYKSTLHNEGPIQRFLADTFRDMQLETDCFIPDLKMMASHKEFSPVEWTYDNRPVVVAKWASNGPKRGKSLIVQGHVDVVSPEPVRLWNYDPWGATIEGDRMYGRGIMDMKAGVSAMIYAVKAIQASGIELSADLLIETVLEEECTGNGALATLVKGYVADGALIPEPSGHGVSLSQVGVIWFRVRITGAGAHVSGKAKSINAIEKAYVLIQALGRYSDKINNAPKHPEFGHVNHPLNVNIGVIKGGDWPSTVPADCYFEVRAGLYPGQDPQDVKDDVLAWLLEAASQDEWLREVPPEITFFGFHANGVVIDPKEELFSVLESAHGKVLDEPMQYRSGLTALTDIRHYNLYYNIPATCYGPRGGNIHSADEWVDLPSLKACTKVYAAFILEWCGVRDTSVE